MIGTGAGLIFKGSGFYTTDSKASSARGKDGEGSKEPEGKKAPEKKVPEKVKEEKEQKK